MRWRSTVALMLLVTAAGCLGGAPASAPDAPAVVTLDAEPAGQDGIYVHLGLQGPEGLDVAVVVSHDDPLDGPTVDRIAPLLLRSANITHASLHGLPTMHVLDVRVVGGPIAAATGSDGELDDESVLALPTLAPGLQVLPVPDAGHPISVRAAHRTVARERGDGVHLLDQGEGRVLVAWMAWSDAKLSSLRVAASSDHGKTFGPAFTVSDRIRPEGEGYFWSWAAHADRTATFLVNEWDGTLFDATRRPSSTLVRLHEDGTMARQELGPGLRVPGQSVLVDADGHLLMLAMNGTPTEESVSTPRLWSIGQDGQVALLHSFQGLPGRSVWAGLGLDARGQHAVVAWTVARSAFATGDGPSVQVSHSLDGPTGFGPAKAPGGPPRAAIASAVQVDERGVAHMLVRSSSQPAVFGSPVPVNWTASYMTSTPQGTDTIALTGLGAAFPAGSTDDAHLLDGLSWIAIRAYERTSWTVNPGHSSEESGHHAWLVARNVEAGRQPTGLVGLGLSDGVWGATFEAFGLLRGRLAFVGSAVDADGEAGQQVMLATLYDPTPPEGQLGSVWRTPAPPAASPSPPQDDVIDIPALSPLAVFVTFVAMALMRRR